MRRRTRRLLLGAGAVPVALIALLGVEVQLARGGPDLDDETPLDHDGLVGEVGDERESLRVVWLGDSTAAGVGASSADAAVPRRVARALDRPVELTVRAISGATVADLLREQVEGLESLRPEVVLVSIGANDVTHLTSKERFRARYRDLVEAVPDGALLVLLGVPDFGVVPRFHEPLRSVAGWRGNVLDGVVRAVARDSGAQYVDIAGETGPRMGADPGRTFAADRYHPSDAGYAFWADAVVAVLVPALPAPEPATGGVDVDR